MSTEPTPDSIADLTLAWARGRNLPAWFAKETTSTNTVSKTELGQLSPALFLCERQTTGRGRGPNSWSSAPDALLCTWRYRLSFSPQPILSPLIGLALFEACRDSFENVPFNLKAPNDLYVADKKLAGLLIELSSVGSEVTCAIGLGLNADQAPADLSNQAVGLGDLVDRGDVRLAWPRFMTALERGFAAALNAAANPAMNQDVRERLREAMNLHPRLKEPILNVGPFGQIESASRTIDWHEL